ncbi:MAG: HTTM domain-containing protein [Bacteroidia bacterium]|nr:HTTM domain-containing protein [Bacteroidia bacterium]
MKPPFTHITRLLSWLETPVPVAPLVTLRIGFGLMMLVATVRFLALGWVQTHYLEPVFHFTFFGFGWVRPLPAPLMYGLHYLMIVCSVGIIIGWQYRVAALVFAVSFTYCELIDLAYYLNHYYFISLMAFLLALVPAAGDLSVDAFRHPAHRRTTVPRWMTGLFQVQIAIVYVYAGWAKLNTDWLLHALPLRIWLPQHQDIPLLGPLLAYPETAYVFSWAGMLYDSTIVGFLCWSRTRWWAYAAVIVFHVLTGILFPIGMFPAVMILIAPIFFPARIHAQVVEYLRRYLPPLPDAGPIPPPEIRGRVFRYLILGLYLGFQVLFPWRYLLYRGNLFWNEEGFRFSWRVMLVEKTGTARFYVQDGPEGSARLVPNAQFLNAWQEKQMAFQPDMILQYAHFLGAHYRAQGMQDPQVRASVSVSLNGRPARPLVDPALDLLTVQDGWAQKNWVLEEN